MKGGFWGQALREVLAEGRRRGFASCCSDCLRILRSCGILPLAVDCCGKEFVVL